MTEFIPDFLCVVCNKMIMGQYGNNADPLAEGKCCDNCDKKVIAHRFNILMKQETGQGLNSLGFDIEKDL